MVFFAVIKSKAIEILKSLNIDEFHLFGKFINSPVYNNSRIIVKLYSYLKVYYPDYNSLNFTKEKMFKKIFPNGKYRDDKIRELMSQLLELGKKFLIFISSEKNPIELGQFLLSELKKRKLDKLFNIEMSRLIKLLNNNPKSEKIIRYMMDLQTFKIEQELIHGHYEQNYNNVQIYKDYLVAFFLIRLFKTYQDLRQIEGGALGEKNDYLIEEFIQKIEHDDFLKKLSPMHLKQLLEAYYSMMLVYLYNKNKDYFKFKNSIIKLSNKLTKDENYDLFISLSNCCQHLILQGKLGFKELFEVNKLILSKEAYYNTSGPYLAVANVRNIIISSLSQKEFGWTEKFIEKYQNEIEPSQRNNIVNYSTALLNYHKKDYEKALEYLLKVKFKSIFFKIDVRTLLLRIYYELNAYDSFGSLAQTFGHMIRKSKVWNEKRKTNLNNFLKLSSGLIKLKNSEDKNKLEMLKSEILKNNEVSFKAWLLEKVAELEGEKIV